MDQARKSISPVDLGRSDSQASRARPADPAAHDDLRYIRDAMEAARQFTAVPGMGLIAMGLLGAVASGLSLVYGTPWNEGQHPTGLVIWLVALSAAMAVGTSAMLGKAARTGQSLRSELFRKVIWGLTPGLLLGGILTAAIVLNGAGGWLLPPVWLGCYGLSVLAAGQVSVWSVRIMGLGFLGLAALSVLTPAPFGLLWLAAGFGALHIAFGAYITWRYDG